MITEDIMAHKAIAQMTFEPRVLVVDDEQRIRDGCHKMLTRDGFQVASAPTADLALEMIEQEHFDIILLDLMMPGLSGMEALVRIRTLHPDTVVIVITGYATLEHSIEAMKNGAFDFISKPFSPRDLRKIIGKSLDYIRSLQDITSEKSRMRVLINHLGDGVMAIDNQKRIALANPAFLKMIGYQGGSVIGHPHTDIIEDKNLKQMIEMALSMPGDEFRELTAEIDCAGDQNGDGAILSARCVPFRDRLNRTIGAITVLHDITSLKKLDQHKSDFVSMVAHEIRSPMNTVLAQLNVVSDGLTGDVSEKQKEIMGRCCEKVKALADLSTELLDLSKIESGLLTQDREKLIVAELLKTQAAFFRDQAQAKNIRLLLEPPPEFLAIMANRYNMQEVLSNLITNAIKYTSEDGQVTIAATKEDNFVCIRVSDTGMGIPKEDLGQIFQKFYRVKNEKTRFIIGTGLGLSIVKSVVEAHHGRIDVESELDKGTTFYVYIPIFVS